MSVNWPGRHTSATCEQESSVGRLIVVEDLGRAEVRGQGGQSMRVLQVLEGLRRLGHEPVFLEFLPRQPDAASIQYFAETIEKWWSAGAAALVVESPLASVYGLGIEEIQLAAANAEAVLTIAAHYRRDFWPLVDQVRPRILFEQDPGYTHIWAAGGDPTAIFGAHDIYFTVGANVGTSRSAIPTSGIDWHPLWNPVVLEWWDHTRPVTRDRFTSIADWRGYGYLEFEGASLGPKAEEFRRFMQLPHLAGESLELVLNIAPDDPDLELLRRNGWCIESPDVVWSPDMYRDYVFASTGEFSCAKGGYVGTRSGWFSDRSACYLAAGRPVVVQATGFEDVLPTGEGLFAVSTPEEAAEAIRAVRSDYSRHAHAARKIAREFFDSDVVLAEMLRQAGVES
jgi:hypothetical protein